MTRMTKSELDAHRKRLDEQMRWLLASHLDWIEWAERNGIENCPDIAWSREIQRRAENELISLDNFGGS